MNVESDKAKQRSARSRLDSRKEIMALTSNRKHRVSKNFVQVVTPSLGGNLIFLC